MPQPRSAFLALLCALAVIGTSSALGRILRSHAHAHQASVCGPGSLMPSRSDIARIARVTLCLINRQRAAHRLAPLRYNAALGRAARGHSVDMVVHGYFSHASRDGGSPFARIYQSGYVSPSHACALGENIAAGMGTLGTPAAIVHAWMNSPLHRANILDSDYRDTAVGVAYGYPGSNSGGATFTEDFGRLC